MSTVRMQSAGIFEVPNSKPVASPTIATDNFHCFHDSFSLCFFDFTETELMLIPGTLQSNLLIQPDKLGAVFLITIFLLVMTLITISIVYLWVTSPRKQPPACQRESRLSD